MSITRAFIITVIFIIVSVVCGYVVGYSQYRPTQNDDVLIRVVDGDTIKVKHRGQLETVRLLDVDAPESTPLRFGYIEKGGKEATQCLKDYLQNKKIEIISEGDYDVYDRLLAYVVVDGKNVNDYILSNCGARER